MAMGTAMIIGKEVAKKVIKETGKQIAKEVKNGPLKDALKNAVKEDVKDKVKEEIQENVMDISPIEKTASVIKTGKLDGLLMESIQKKPVGEMQEKKITDANIQSESSLKSMLDKTIKGDEYKEILNFECTDEVTTIETEQKNYESNSYVIIEGQRYRTDDNGNVYQRRNPDTGVYECLPNIKYDLNGYHYETDEHGRIIKAEGTLREKSHEGRSTINDSVNGMEKTDEKGHLIGDQFEGSNLSGNLVAMDFDVNRSDYKKLEEKLSKMVNEEHKKVEINIEVKYDGDSKRPTTFTVKYTVDGEIFKETFKN